MNIKQNSLTGGLFSLPWCCIVPASFSLMGLAGVAVSTSLMKELAPFLLFIGLFFIGRAHVLIYVKKQGNRTSHLITWLSSLVAMTVWGLQWLG